MRWAVLATALAAGCLRTNLPPLTSSRAQLEDDERALWRDAAEQEKRFETAGVIYTDAALTAYLEEVTQRLATAAGVSAFHFRVHVLRSPYLNAFTLPDGAIYVNAGMLARIEDEAQLATLLGHEMSHALRRHAARELRDLDNKALAGAAFNSLLPGLGALAAFSAVRGYSRELETEADEVGFRMVVAAGYDAGECPRIFLALQQELRDEKENEPFFFGTHPALQDRIESFRRLAGPNPRPGAGVDASAFLSRTLQLAYDAATLDLRWGRTVAAQRTADRLVAHDPGSPRGAFLQGEIARQSQSLDRAVLQYRKAIELDERFPQPYRALGLILMKRGEKPAARAALAKYLELSPTADDRAYVERDLEMLR